MVALMVSAMVGETVPSLWPHAHTDRVGHLSYRLRGGEGDDPGYEFRTEGCALLAAGERAAALAAYEKAVELAPTDSTSLTALGRLLEQERGNQQEAFDLFVRAVHANPDSQVALSNYAFGLENWCGRPLLAEDAYWRAEALDPTNVPVLVNLAALLEQQLQERDPRYNAETEAVRQRQCQAHELYVRALSIEPQNRNTLCNFAGMLMTHGDHGDDSEQGLQRGGQRAAELLARALALTPNDPAVLVNYGVLMEDWGDNKELARHLYQKAVDSEPAHSVAVCSLARILRILKRLPEAEAVARTAIALYPPDSKADDVLEIERELWRVRQIMQQDPKYGEGGGGASSAGAGGGAGGGPPPQAAPRVGRGGRKGGGGGGGMGGGGAVRARIRVGMVRARIPVGGRR